MRNLAAYFGRLLSKPILADSFGDLAAQTPSEYMLHKDFDGDDGCQCCYLRISAPCQP